MKSFIPYLGGKSRLAKQIISMFPEHTTYVEVFGGAGNIFFRKEPVDVEVIGVPMITVSTSSPTPTIRFWQIVSQLLKVSSVCR